MSKRTASAIMSLTVLVGMLSSAATSHPLSAHAQTPQPSGPPLVQLTQDGSAVVLSFNMTQMTPATGSGSRSTQALQTLQAQWPRIRYGDLILPGRTVLVQLDGNESAERVLADARAARSTLVSLPYAGPIEQVAVPVPQTPDGQQWPDLQREPETALPTSPVSVIRQGTLRGQRLAVLAVTPVFTQAGETRFATRFEVILPNARTLGDASPLLGAFAGGTTGVPGGGDRDRQSSAVACGDASYQPVNQQLKNGLTQWRIRVSRGGMQQVSAAQLSAAGVTDLSKIRMTFRGQPVAIRRFGNAAIRFYATDPGDRWNATDTYWLSVEENPSLRSPEIGYRAAPTNNPAASTVGLQRGTFTEDKIYDATMPGADGDHWFALDMRPGGNTNWSFIAPVILPTAGDATVYVSGATKTAGTHSFVLNGAGASVPGPGTFTATFSLPAGFAGPAQLAYTTAGIAVALPDRVSWERKVSLAFGGNGARFAINGSAATYQALNSTSPPPASQGNDALYDVTDPITPQAVIMDDGGKFTHGGGDRTYVMAGNGTLFISDGANGPVVSTYSPFPLDGAFNLSVLYITPASFFGAADALTKHRQAQGYSAGYFDVATIYDWWSFGQVSPVAIRNFLRYAYCTWSNKPFAVTMIGDGTVDPFDRIGIGPANVNLIPPYMAPVDPFLTTSLGAAETACEACFSQLDGANALSDVLADLYYGRLPAKTVAEASALANKIIGYETANISAGGDMAWRNKLAYIADNYYLTNDTGPSAPTDGAGNFANFADASISHQPSSVQIARMYYDPPAPANHPYRISNPVNASNAAKAMFNSGAGLITYFGHGNIVQMAVTEWAPTKPDGSAGDNPGTLIGFRDPDVMSNAGKLPVVLQMTCLSSAFQTAFKDGSSGLTNEGTTIDERLVLAPNGAVAVWGSSSLGVGYSHDALLSGFLATLWAGSPYKTSVGKAAAGGYAQLFAQSQGIPQIDNLLYTFMVMGDPMTLARVGPGNRQYAPAVNRSN